MGLKVVIKLYFIFLIVILIELYSKFFIIFRLLLLKLFFCNFCNSLNVFFKVFLNGDLIYLKLILFILELGSFIFLLLFINCFNLKLLII